MPPEIQRLTDQFLHNPVRVEVSRPAMTADNIVQEVIQVPNNDWAKREALRRLIRENPVKNAIVFCNRKRDVDVVAKSLQSHGFSAAALHGDLDQSVRTRTLEGFKNDEIRFLVASDVAARGLDIPAVSHIFNFDVPFHADDYVHRIGRTGRAGRSGHAYMLATSRDMKSVDAIEKLIGKPIDKRVMEGIEVREDRHEGPRQGRDAHRRGPKDRSRGPQPHSRPHAAMHAAPPVAPREAAPVDVQAPASQPEVQQLPPQQHQPRQQPRHQPRPAQKPQEQRQHAKPREAVPEVVDINRLPAFLLRPINLPKTEKPARPAKRKDADAEV
jgi:superfamily II DNA/RNA helicase